MENPRESPPDVRPISSEALNPRPYRLFTSYEQAVTHVELGQASEKSVVGVPFPRSQVSPQVFGITLGDGRV